MKIAVVALAFACLTSAGALSQQSASLAAMHMDQPMPGMHEMPNAQPLPGMSIYNLTRHWTTQDGTTEQFSALRGRPVVAAMVYTHCRDICPLTAERMKEVERSLAPAGRDSVQFVLFSLDWVRDTPDQLKHFASQHGLVSQRWTLFHGSENAVRELAAVLGVSFYRGANGDFQHSIAIFAIGPDGVVRFEQTDLGRPTTALATAVRKLLKKEEQVPVRRQ